MIKIFKISDFSIGRDPKTGHKLFKIGHMQDSRPKTLLKEAIKLMKEEGWSKKEILNYVQEEIEWGHYDSGRNNE